VLLVSHRNVVAGLSVVRTYFVTASTLLLSLVTRQRYFLFFLVWSGFGLWLPFCGGCSRLSIDYGPLYRPLSSCLPFNPIFIVSTLMSNSCSLSFNRSLSLALYVLRCINGNVRCIFIGIFLVAATADAASTTMPLLWPLIIIKRTVSGRLPLFFSFFFGLEFLI